MSENNFHKHIDSIIKRGINNIDPKNICKELLECLDLTTLSSLDNNESILNLVNRSNELNNNNLSIAGICVFPKYIKTLKNSNLCPNISIISVAGGFPFGQLPIELCINEIKYSVENGADEIDLVMNRGEFLSGNYKYVSQETFLSKKEIPNGKLKIIIETGELKDLELIKKASLINLESGADFIKTSTGKIKQGGDPYSFAIMLESIDEFAQKTGILKGIKASGGIRTLNHAIVYYILYIHYFGHQRFTKDRFRIGGSSLLDSIIKEL